MAITNIVSGELRNKVGAMVGAKWKGISYVRAYVKQKDADTEAQRAVRSQFKKVTLFGSAINEGVLKPYQARAVKNMSPYNRFTQVNQEVIADESKGYESMRIFSGSLPVATDMSATASAASGTVKVSYTPCQHGTAHRHDTLIVVVYNETGDTYGFTTVDRGEGSGAVMVSVPVWFGEGDSLHVYLTASRKGKANGGTLYAGVTAGV
ncbi:DUF6266 family protein [Breznakiella homolactica]|uniref:Uncharacterized protein n=1 Tax=Breznakiella homolactica TaxID=2798577 RepID=A0A7T7XKA9_9SPIR|nr:DUF6266 family protein [Breznakiella homolactica]QQO07870.1 DUF6266 family protein [Breznakiella homolactica]